MDGTFPSEGRVEVFRADLGRNGEWGTVNTGGFGPKDAHVVCRSLGFVKAREFHTSAAVFGPGTGLIAMDDVGCQGNEASILDCNYNRRHDVSDNHQQDVGVRCEGIT